MTVNSHRGVYRIKLFVSYTYSNKKKKTINFLSIWKYFTISVLISFFFPFFYFTCLLLLLLLFVPYNVSISLYFILFYFSFKSGLNCERWVAERRFNKVLGHFWDFQSMLLAPVSFSLLLPCDVTGTIVTPTWIRMRMLLLG